MLNKKGSLSISTSLELGKSSLVCYRMICCSYVCWLRIYCSDSQSSTTSVYRDGNSSVEVLFRSFHEYSKPASRYPSFLNSTHQLKEKRGNRFKRQAHSLVRGILMVTSAVCRRVGGVIKCPHQKPKQVLQLTEEEYNFQTFQGEKGLVFHHHYKNYTYPANQPSFKCKSKALFLAP